MLKIKTSLPFVAASLLLLASCSEGMEERRPVPVDLSQFHPGENRLDVVSVVGAPAGTVSGGVEMTPGSSCDAYQLYTSGLGGFGKGMVTAGEALTDLATLGIAEIFWTPIQSGTQPSPHTVLFCYDKNDKLVSLTNKKPT